MTKIDYQGWELEHFDNSKNFRNYQNDLIKNYIRGYTAEIGPGNGENLQLYLDRVEKVDLFEPSKILFENLQSKYHDNQNVVLINKEFSLTVNTYDTILYLDVLEHIQNDLDEINKSFNSLKSGGKLIINVPAFQYLYSKFDEDVNHFRRYDKKSFTDLIQNLDHSSYQMKYYDSVGYLLSLISKIFLNDYKKNFHQKIKIWNSLIPLSKVLDKLCFNLFGKSLIVIINKK